MFCSTKLGCATIVKRLRVLGDPMLQQSYATGFSWIVTTRTLSISQWNPGWLFNTSLSSGTPGHMQVTSTVWYGLAIFWQKRCRRSFAGQLKQPREVCATASSTNPSLDFAQFRCARRLGRPSEMAVMNWRAFSRPPGYSCRGCPSSLHHCSSMGEWGFHRPTRDGTPSLCPRRPTQSSCV